jgi:hypothetical protein
MRPLPFAAAALLAAFPAAAQEASGWVQTEHGRVEISGGRTFFGTAMAPAPGRPVSSFSPRPPAHPEPFDFAQDRLRGAESKGPPLRGGEREVGATLPAPPREVGASATADPCRAPRSAYLRQLLRTTGVDVDDPLALLDELAGPRGYDAATLFTPYGLLPGVDPIRPLAWDSELRRLARDLVRCGREAR